MSDPEYAQVLLDDGVGGYIVGPSEQNSDEVLIALDDGREISVPARSLTRSPEGVWRLGGGEHVIPVISEELDIGTRKRITGTLRVGKQVSEHDETVSMPLTRERAEVRRVVINRPVDAAPPVRRDGDTMIFPVVEEVPVVRKVLMLKEEIHVTRRRTTEQHDQTVTLRNEMPSIERHDQQGRPVASPVETVQEKAPVQEQPRGPRQSILGPTHELPVRKNKIIKDE